MSVSIYLVQRIGAPGVVIGTVAGSHLDSHGGSTGDGRGSLRT